MTHNCLDTAHDLPDHELLSRVKTLAARERAATAELVAHLAELDARKLYLPAGYNSMFAYCCEALSLSEDAAYNRIEVARATRRFPVVLDLLTEGAVTLTAAKLLARHLTEDNHAAVLQSARGLRTSEVEKLVAALSPRPDAPTVIRRLAAVSVAAPIPPTLAAPISPILAAPPVPAPPVAPAPVPPSPPATFTALAPERYKMQVTISGEALDLLEMAKDLLRHALPTGDVAAVLERALKALVAEQLKKKFADTDRPQRSRGTAAGSREVAAEVRRAAYLRDRGRCAFVGTGGRRCNERAFVEFHHLRPFAHDGPATVENIELRCRAHNVHEWELLSTDLRRQEEAWLCRRYSSHDESSGPHARRKRNGVTARDGVTMEVRSP